MTSEAAIQANPDAASPPGIRERAALALAKCWDSASLRYAVTGGLARWPDRLGRDLDVLIRREDWSRAVSMTRSKLEELGWQSVCFDRPWSRLIFAFRKDGERWIGLEVDFFPELRWAFTQLLEGPGKTFLKEPFQYDPWATFVKGTLIQVLSGKFDRMKARGLPVALVAAHRVDLKERLTADAGQSLAEETLSSIESGDFEGIREVAPSLRRLYHQKALRSGPVALVRGAAGWTKRRWMLGVPAREGVPSMALVGPDGAGKSSAIEALERIFSDDLRFPGVERRHWRPGLLPALGALRPGRGRNVSGHMPGPPRRRAGRFGWLRMTWYGLDFILGTRLLDRRATLGFRPVVYDRCVLDMAVDPLRYGLREARWLLPVCRRLTRPELVVLLRGDPDRIHARKSEIGVAEIRRQYEIWERLRKDGDVSWLESEEGGPEAVAQRICTGYIHALLGRERPNAGSGGE